MITLHRHTATRLLGAALLLLSGSLLATPEHVYLGVLAYRGEATTHQQWQATVDYLNSALPDYRFHLRPLLLEEMGEALRRRRIDFVLTNSGHYVTLEAEHGISRLLTLEPGNGVPPEQGIGSVVITRSDRSDINDFDDLKGKSIAAVSRGAFGGFQVVWRELQQHHIDPFNDLRSAEFAGYPMDQIAFRVLKGDVDAGILRACTLEKMAAEGRLELTAFKIVSARNTAGFPCRHSTRLYPNWPLAKRSDTPDELAKQVAQTLLALPVDSQAAQSGGYHGWTIPVDYQAVHELFRELHIGPYRWRKGEALIELWDHYWQWLGIFLVALGWWVWHTARVEFLVRRRTEQLRREMEERHRAEERLQLQQIELAHVSRVSSVGELASGMAHELNQPLSAINSYAQGTIWRLEAGDLGNEELLDVQRQIVAQAERAGTIIERFRGFLRKEPIRCDDVDINHVIREAAALFSSEAKRRAIHVALELAPRLPPICSEAIQLEQVLLNLMRNGSEAMAELEPAQRTLTLRSDIGEEERLVIEVHNPGAAIPAEQLPHLFTPFHTTKSDGMGLGLSISRSIIESQGGSIYCSESGSSGTTMRIELPLHREEM